MSKIVVRKTNLQSEENKVLKEQKRGEGGGGRTTKLNPVSKDLNLGNPTWFSLPGWVMKTVMPFT